jgi:hypothetical protein
VIGGVHYPTDTEAGLLSASVIDNVLLHESRFLADFARARAEVRHAIGLHQEGDARDSQPPESSAWRASEQKVQWPAVIEENSTTSAVSYHAFRIVNPPSTGITAPVRYEAAGRHKLKVICATSSG